MIVTEKSIPHIFRNKYLRDQNGSVVIGGGGGGTVTTITGNFLPANLYESDTYKVEYNTEFLKNLKVYQNFEVAGDSILNNLTVNGDSNLKNTYIDGDINLTGKIYVNGEEFKGGGDIEDIKLEDLSNVIDATPKNGYLLLYSGYLWDYVTEDELLKSVKIDLENTKEELLTKFLEEINKLKIKPSYEIEITEDDLLKDDTDYPVAARIPIFYNYVSPPPDFDPWAITEIHITTGDGDTVNILFKHRLGHYDYESSEVIISGTLKDHIRNVGIVGASLYHYPYAGEDAYIVIRFKYARTYQICADSLTGDTLGAIYKGSSTVSPNGGAGLPKYGVCTDLSDQYTDYNYLLTNKIVQPKATIDKLTTCGIVMDYHSTSSDTWSIFMPNGFQGDYYESGEDYLLRYWKGTDLVEIGRINDRIRLTPDKITFKGYEIFHERNAQDHLDNLSAKVNAWMIPFQELLSKVEVLLGDIELALDKILGDPDDYLEETLDDIIG